jgi:hypothetical protein
MSKRHGLQEYSPQEGRNLSLGQAGYVYLETSSGSLVHSDVGHYNAITVLEDDCQISVQLGTSAHDSIMDDIISKNITAGTTIYGAWTRVSIKRTGSNDTSVIVYNA